MDKASESQASASLLEKGKPGPGESATQPAPEVREAANAKIISLSGLFDSAWYVETYPDVTSSGLDPALHYIRIGGAERRAPSSAFDAADYVSRYPDVAKTGMNPLLHYVIFGQNEKRTAKPAGTARIETSGNAAVKPPEPVTPQKTGTAAAPAPGKKAAGSEAENLEFIAGSGFFDAEWYQRRYMAKADPGLSPALHYLRHGGVKGHYPSPAFDAADYLARYKDVREAGMNPLLHYLRFGRAEKRIVKPVEAEDDLAALVSASSLHDEQWYLAAYPEVAKSKLSPLRHFLKHGREKLHHPGPGFNAEAYVAANADVTAGNINPLVHYLQTGQAEGRAITEVTELPKRAAPKPKKEPARPAEPKLQKQHPAPAPAQAKPSASIGDISADLALLEATPLFDKNWYLARYPEAGKQGMSPAEHYLRHGEMRQPSIFFDPQYYAGEESPEIQYTAVNPLLHFLKTGKALGRKPRALFEASPNSTPLKPLEPSSWPLVPAALPAERNVAWVNHAELKQRQEPGSLFIDRTLIAWSPDVAVFSAARGVLSVFMEISGLDRSGSLRMKGTRSGLAIGYDAHSYRGLGKALTSGSAAIADAWLTASRTLRVRFGDAEQQVESGPLVVRAFHVNAAASPAPILAGEGLVGTGGPVFVDFALSSPFSPLLIVVSQTGGETVGIGLLPFPSLCRGGHHHAELVGAAPVSDPVSELRSVSDDYVRKLMAGRTAGTRLLSRITIGVSHASGTEQIFSPDMLGWITSVFGIPVVPLMSRQADTAGEAYLRQSLAAARPPVLEGAAPAGPGRFTLELPADAIPTIAVLAAQESDGAAADTVTGSWYVAEAITGRPRFSVTMPQSGEDLLRLQPPWAPLGFPVLRRDTPGLPRPARHSGGCPHLAIRHAEPRELTRAAMLMPLAPDSSHSILGTVAAPQAVDVILRATSIEASETFLRSLLRQANTKPGQIRIECQSGGIDPEKLRSVADSLVPGRASVIVTRSYLPLGTASLLPDSVSPFTLAADDTVVLHDTRTLEALTVLAAAENTASAACVLLREVPSRKGSTLSFESGGYFPTHVSLLSLPRLMLSLTDCRGAFPNMTYPVIANDPALVMLNNEAVRLIGAGADAPAAGQVPDSIAFSLQALAAGYRHLCTTAVRAAAIGAPARQNISDPPGLSCFGAQRWEQILGSAAILRELH